MGDKQGIATTLGQLGRLAQQQGHLQEALQLFLIAYVMFESLHSPYQELAGRLIAEIRQEVGEERFAEWMQAWITETSENTESGGR